MTNSEQTYRGCMYAHGSDHCAIDDDTDKWMKCRKGDGGVWVVILPIETSTKTSMYDDQVAAA